MLIKSQLATQMSGSIGGLTASHNKGGMYFRARSTPTNPNTVRQQAVRSIFGSLVQLWNTITQEQREGWELYASEVTKTNRLGDAVKLSGQARFIGANTPRLQAGLAPVLAAPTIYNTGEPVSALDSATFDTGTATVTLDFANAAVDSGNVLLYVGQPLNSGKLYYDGPWQLAALEPFIATDVSVQIAADTTDPDEWFTAYPWAVGLRVPILARVTYDDGRLSQRFRTVANVTTP